MADYSLVDTWGEELFLFNDVWYRYWFYFDSFLLAAYFVPMQADRSLSQRPGGWPVLWKQRTVIVSWILSAICLWCETRKSREWTWDRRLTTRAWVSVSAQGFRTTSGQSSFCSQQANPWNALPTELKLETNINVLNKKTERVAEVGPNLFSLSKAVLWALSLGHEGYFS